MQFTVPQDVQREDTIIFNITIRQMVICLIGGGLAYAIYIGFSNRGFGTIFWAPPVVIISLLTAAIAFLRINEVSFTKYVLLFVERLINPQKRMWRQGAAEVYRGIFAEKPVDKKKRDEKAEQEAQVIEERKKTFEHISRLSEILDKPRFGEATQHPIIDELHDDALLHSAFETGKETKEDIEKHKSRLNELKPTIPKAETVKIEPPLIEKAVETKPAPKTGEISMSGTGGTIEIHNS